MSLDAVTMESAADGHDTRRSRNEKPILLNQILRHQPGRFRTIKSIRMSARGK